MKTLEFGLGDSLQVVCLPEENLAGVLGHNPVPLGLSGVEEVRRALEHPIGSPRLRDLVRPGETVALVSSDITRPMPTALVMPLVMAELYLGGIRKEDITLVLGLGIHRPHTAQERRQLAGEQAWNEILVVDSNPLDVVRLGRTRRGTPADFDRRVAQADRRVCLGNIEYHYFAGYSGGAKALMPGVSTGEAIQENHRMMVQEKARAGLLEGNPVREDIEEAAGMLGIDFILNVVLDEQKRVVRAVAGDAVLAHREGCAFLDAFYAASIRELADIVLVSQGGAPKDLNLYQTQKALDNAAHAVREGGIIILIGSCREGMGEETFAQWMLEARQPQELIDRVRRDFRLGGHKAAAIAMVLKKARIFLVSDMEEEFVKTLFMTPFATAQAALMEAFALLGKDARVLAMPHGGSTLPRLALNHP